jgi:hypothetical protein
MHWAAQSGHADAIKALKEAEADDSKNPKLSFLKAFGFRHRL